MSAIESWFNTPERLARLEFHAVSWEGTPWLPNSNTKGRRGGVSCQKLVAELYKEVGFAADLDVAKEIPNVAMCHAVFAQPTGMGATAPSLLVPFMEGRKDFVKIELASEAQKQWPPLNLLRVGDLLGMKIKGTVHHCGILIGQHVFVHVMRQLGTIFSSLTDGTWSSRLACAWRPVGMSTERELKMNFAKDNAASDTSVSIPASAVNRSITGSGLGDALPLASLAIFLK